jgi:hypothetical protein
MVESLLKEILAELRLISKKLDNIQRVDEPKSAADRIDEVRRRIAEEKENVKRRSHQEDERFPGTKREIGRRAQGGDSARKWGEANAGSPEAPAGTKGRDHQD